MAEYQAETPLPRNRGHEVVAIVETSIAERHFVVQASPERVWDLLGMRLLRAALQLGQKVTFTLTAVDEGKTEVVCKAVAEGMATVFRWPLLKKAQDFAGETLSRIEERLHKLA